MDELIQTSTDLKPGFDRPQFGIFQGRSGCMEMVKAAIIFDVSRMFLICGLTPHNGYIEILICL